MGWALRLRGLNSIEKLRGARGPQMMPKECLAKTVCARGRVQALSFGPPKIRRSLPLGSI